MTTLTTTARIAEIVANDLPRHRKKTAIRFDTGHGYESLRFDAYVAHVRRMIAWFAAQGAEGRVVATFSKNRPEWDMTALAALYRGNVLFPLDTTMNDAELGHLLRQSPPDFVLVSRAGRARMRAILAELGQAPRVLVADLFDVFEDAGAEPVGELAENEMAVSAIPEAGSVPPPSVRLDDPATVLGHYSTSGTTSLPKIVRITHGNIDAQLEEATGILNLRRNEDLLNIGPYTHIATLLEFLVTKTKGFAVTYFTREADEDGVLEGEIKKLRRQGVRIKALMAVPKFWVYIMKEALEEMKNKPLLHGLYRHLIGIERSADLQDVGTLDKAKMVAVRRTLRNKMGGYFSYGITSSTRIDPGVVDIFAKLGVTVIDIYGATEASGIVARNKLNEHRRGSCGRLLKSLEARIRDGELQLRGPTITPGYLGEDAGAHVDDDGFYATGDLARIDEDGYVFLIGRRKELIEWDDGTFIDPMHLSNLLARSIWVKDALVTRLPGDVFLSVFLHPDRKRIENDRMFAERVRSGLPPDRALRPMLEEAIDQAQSLARITPRLSKERIYLLDRKLERTPTHKIKLLTELKRLDLTRFV